jgi:predicted amidohydrolase YtcJ
LGLEERTVRNMPDHERTAKTGLSRRRLLKAGAAAGVSAALAGAGTGAAAAAPGAGRKPVFYGSKSEEEQLLFVNGKIHTFDADNSVVSSVAIRNGRFAGVGKGARAGGPGTKVINLKGRTVLPGLIDNHTHLVLVGNRPGYHVLAEDVFTADDLVARFIDRMNAMDVPPGALMTTIGPIAAQQFPGNALPSRAQLDAIPRPVYLQAAQGGVRTNTAGFQYLVSRGIVPSNPAPPALPEVPATASLQLLRATLLTPETRRRTTFDAMQYYNGLGLTTHADVGAFQSDTPLSPGGGGIANENNYTMHFPFIQLNDAGRLPARLRINFLHQDPATDPTLPTLAPRLRNAFKFFGDDWVKTAGIGEFIGGGLFGLRAVADAGWRGEDHALSLNAVTTHIVNRETIQAEGHDIRGLRWILSHVPVLTPDLINRWQDLGGGFDVGWGPTRNGTNVGPQYRMIIDSGINVGYHADGGDITVINPWLNFYTMTTGRNLAGATILDPAQRCTRQEVIWLATRANKWFVQEDDLGSIEVGNHADLIVLDRDFFTCPDEEIKQIKSLLTVIGGAVKHDAGVLK